MTLDAQVIGGFKRHHIRFVSGAAGLVTAEALHSEVFIPGVNHLFSNRVSGMGLPLVTLTAYTDTDRGFWHQQNIIGRMRRMAAGAVSRFYRLAQIRIFWIADRPLLKFNRIFMTLSASFANGFFQKIFLF
jgi:hypothetical protein